MIADNDLHKMEKLFRELNVPYRRGAHTRGTGTSARREPYLCIEPVEFCFTAAGKFITINSKRGKTNE